MAYSTLAKIGAKVPKYSGAAHDFAETDLPSLAEVTIWRDEVSGIVDSVLDNYGLTSPATDANMVLVWDAFVADFVAELVNGVRGNGRFGPAAQSKQKKNYIATAYAEITEIAENMAGKKTTGTGSRAVTRADGYSSNKDNVTE